MHEASWPQRAKGHISNSIVLEIFFMLSCPQLEGLVYTGSRGGGGGSLSLENLLKTALKSLEFVAAKPKETLI